MHTAQPRILTDNPASQRDCEADGATHFLGLPAAADVLADVRKIAAKASAGRELGQPDSRTATTRLLLDMLAIHAGDGPLGDMIRAYRKAETAVFADYIEWATDDFRTAADEIAAEFEHSVESLRCA